MDSNTIIAVVVAVMSLVGMIGGLVLRDRQVMKSISDGDNEVHRRVDVIVKDFVQKSDLKEYLKPLAESINQMQQEQRAATQRIDRVLAMVPKRSTD
jgi:hypothetical protein